MAMGCIRIQGSVPPLPRWEWRLEETQCRRRVNKYFGSVQSLKVVDLLRNTGGARVQIP